MSREALREVVAAEALQSALPPESLTLLHVPFDDLVGTRETEARLARAVASGGGSAICIIGPSGSGKSSVWAYELGPLSERAPERLLPLRIPMTYANPATVSDPADLVRYVLGHITRVARESSEILSRAEREGAERRAAERRVDRRGGHRLGLGAGVGLPAIGDARLAAEVASSGREFERRVTAGEVVGALAGLIEVFRERGREPLLIFEDTDTWLESVYGDDARRLVAGFFSQNLVGLKRDLPCGFVVVAHERYLVEQRSFHEAIGRLDVRITIPRFPRPERAIGRILARRLEVADLGVGLGDVLAPDAVTALGTLYDMGPVGRDLRAVVAITAEAVRSAAEEPAGPDLVDALAIRAAAGRRVRSP